MAQSQAAIQRVAVKLRAEARDVLRTVIQEGSELDASLDIHKEQPIETWLSEHEKSAKFMDLVKAVIYHGKQYFFPPIRLLKAHHDVETAFSKMKDVHMAHPLDSPEHADAMTLLKVSLKQLKEEIDACETNGPVILPDQVLVHACLHFQLDTAQKQNDICRKQVAQWLGEIVRYQKAQMSKQ